MIGADFIAKLGLFSLNYFTDFSPIRLELDSELTEALRQSWIAVINEKLGKVYAPGYTAVSFALPTRNRNKKRIYNRLSIRFNYKTENTSVENIARIALPEKVKKEIAKLHRKKAIKGRYDLAQYAVALKVYLQGQEWQSLISKVQLKKTGKWKPGRSKNEELRQQVKSVLMQHPECTVRQLTALILGGVPRTHGTVQRIMQEPEFAELRKQAAILNPLNFRIR